MRREKTCVSALRFLSASTCTWVPALNVNAKHKHHIQLNKNRYCVGTVRQTLISRASNFRYLWVWITWVLSTVCITHKFFNKVNVTSKLDSMRCLNKDKEYFWFKNKLSNTSSLKVVLIKIKSIFGFDLFIYK